MKESGKLVLIEVKLLSLSGGGGSGGFAGVWWGGTPPQVVSNRSDVSVSLG